MFKQNTFVQIAILLCLLGVAAYGQPPAANSKPAESDAQTVKALLDEVRQLRQVLQRNSVATYRAQVTLERLKLQQTQVNELIKEQTELRNDIKEMGRHVSQMPGQVAELEKMQAAATTPSERNEREMMIKGVKGEMENAKLRLQDLREREPQVTARLQTEQAKLHELNESLDKLERELENAATAGEKGKRP
jgi:DNA repair exonuclease SbcCD ATPase subunit